MSDRLSEVLDAVHASKSLIAPKSKYSFELICANPLTLAQGDRVKKFQAEVERAFSLRLVVVGGSPGCLRLQMSVEHSTAQDKRAIVLDLLEDPEFRKIALKYGLSIALINEPHAIAHLPSGRIESLSRDQGIVAFCSYSHSDLKHKNTLDKHLSLLQRQGLVRLWHDRKISVGDEWENVIHQYLDEAQLFILLISSDFLASDYCYEIEMMHAMQRHRNSEARVVPLLVRPVDWSSSPFATLQVLPRNHKPITTWRNRDEAWAEIARELRSIILAIDQLRASPETTP